MKVKGHKWLCGHRYVGFYTVEDPEYDGVPVDNFILCPPPLVDMAAIGLSTSGMRIIERRDPFGNLMGVYDLWDYLSESDQPWVPDYITQTEDYGTSRRFPETLVHDPSFSKLCAHPWDPTLSSRHIFVHAKAIIDVPEPFYQNRTHIKSCPAHIAGHDDNSMVWEMCAALWWESVDYWPKERRNRRYKVTLPRGDENPTCGYEADYIPKGVKPVFLPGIIMSLPLMSMEIPVDNSGDNEHERLMKLLENGGWQYNYEVTED